MQQIDPLAGKVSCLHRQTGDIAAWPRQACDQTAADGVGRQRKNDGDDRRCRFQCRHGRYGGNDDVDRAPDEFGCDLGIALGACLRPAVLDRYGAALDPAECTQPLLKGTVHWLIAAGVVVPRKPITGSLLGCCAGAANYENADYGRRPGSVCWSQV